MHFCAMEKRVKLERQAVLSDARGGFLPASSLTCWLPNGLFSGLADRLAGSQWLRSSLFGSKSWGMVVEG